MINRITAKGLVSLVAITGIVIYLFTALSRHGGEEKQVISRAFELRYVSGKAEADGETDFKGETAIFNTPQRVEFLGKWAEFGRHFFDDPGLDTRIVQDKDIEAVMNRLKPQPLPQVRRKILLDEWNFLGYREGQHEEERKKIEEWNKKEGISVTDGRLVVSQQPFIMEFPEQPWRMRAGWRARSPETRNRFSFGLSDNVIAGFQGGQFFYVTGGEEVLTGKYDPGIFYDFEVELDLATDMGRYNLYVNGEKIADFVPLSTPGARAAADRFTATPGRGDMYIDELHIVGYGPGESPYGAERHREYPYLIETLIFSDFDIRPDPLGFEFHDYDDSRWKQVPYERYAHGGERHKDEALYLRKTVYIDDFERAVINIETVRPAADLFINGQKIARLGRYPARLDISDRLEPGKENLIALRVEPHSLEKARYHMSVDTWSGWFAGLMDIELTSGHYIDDVFAYTTDIGDQASLRLEVKAGSDHNAGFSGQLIARAYPWLPAESAIPAGESVIPVKIERNKLTEVMIDVPISDPALWTVNSPDLYKIVVTLRDDDGNDIDDHVFTTGLRTICQTGGTFRINGRPEILVGPLLFGHHYPIERIAQWMFSPPAERWVHDILLTRRMNGNTIRMSVHDTRFGGVNDRRLAQIGDQMGIMFMWQTPAWVREGPAEGFDFEGLPLYARAVRNHPSIVIWQPGNHPIYPFEWYQRVYDSLAAVDQSRLISPSADITHMRANFKNTIGGTRLPADDDLTYPAWTSPLLARGTMERVMGYGQEWSSLRNFPGMHAFHGIELEVRMAYLNSPTHAWFDYESEETIGQPNWNEEKGKPYYKMNSYEAYYDEGSIGRILRFDEWQESQAWQALSAYEAYRKKRWLGFDGMNWCPLRGGGNTATYMKPVVGYQNHAKLGYYALQMAFQPVLAGSKNVDIVYGPGDRVPVMVMNLGESRTVDVKLLVKTIEGSIVAEQTYHAIRLPDGKGVVDLDEWNPGFLPEGYYAFEYLVLE
jgi:hypothetical protein